MNATVTAGGPQRDLWIEFPMGIYVACSCGQAFSARPDLAGQTLSCPACNQPIRIPHPPAPASLTPLPAGSYVVPQPTVIRQPAPLSTAAVFADPLSAPVPNEAAEGMPPIVLFASIAAGSVLIVLLSVIAVHQVVSRWPNSPPTVAAAPSPSTVAPHQQPGGQTTMPTVVTTHNPAPPTATTSTAPPTRGSREGWIRVTLPDSPASVEFPSDAYQSQHVPERNGMTGESLAWSGGPGSALIIARFRGKQVGEAADRLEEFTRMAGGLASGGQPRQITVQGCKAVEVVQEHLGHHYQRLRFVFISDSEVILISGSARFSTERSNTDHFVESLRISKPAGLQSLLPKFRWPTGTQN